MKFSRYFGFLFLVSSFTIPELSAKGGKQHVLDLPPDERITYCKSKIDEKVEELKEVRAFLPERAENLERQIQNYHNIKDALEKDSDNEFLPALILSMQTLKAVNPNAQNQGKEKILDDDLLSAMILSKEIANMKREGTLDDDLLSVMILSEEIWNAENKGVQNQGKGLGLKAEVETSTKQLLKKQPLKIWGQHLIDSAGKYLSKIRNDKLNQLTIGGVKYKDLKKDIDNVTVFLEQAQLDNDGNPLLPGHPEYYLVKQKATLEKDEAKYIKKLEVEFPGKEMIIALQKEYGLSEKQANLLFDILIGNRDDKDPEVTKELYNK